MEKLARKFAGNIARALNYHAEQEAVIAYGLIAVFQIVLTTLLVLIFGILVGAPIEALIVCFSVSILRQYSGGAHAGTAELCAAIAIVYCTGAAVVSRRLLWVIYRPIPMCFSILILYLIAFLILNKYAPVDSPSKPVRTESKRKRMRKYSFIILAVYFFFSLLFFVFGSTFNTLNSYGISLLLGIVWQVFTLTPTGIALFHNA